VTGALGARLMKRPGRRLDNLHPGRGQCAHPSCKVAIDGSKFKAVNAKAKSFTREKLQRRLGEIDSAIARYMAELNRADQVQSKTGMALPEARVLRAMKKLAHYKSLRISSSAGWAVTWKVPP
jgi:hypothetical protein